MSQYIEKALELERQLADAHTRIKVMIREVNHRDELISDHLPHWRS
jgi:hypothetical protein